MAIPKRGVSYARFSREEGDDTFSVDSQNRRNLEYAQKNHIAVSEENVIFDYFTGTTLDREGFNQVIRLIQQGQIDCVIVYRVNRIARKDYLASWFLQEIVFRHRVELHIVEWGRAVKDTKEDIMLFGVQSMFAQIDHMSIREQTMRGRREKAEQGIWLGQGTTVYGFSKTGTRRNTQLFINEDEADVVRLIFKLFVHDQLPCAEIARILDAKGTLSPSQIRMRRGRQTPWDKDSIRNILRDTRYIGIFYAFKWEYINNKRVRRDEQEVIKQYFPNLAFIDEDTFYAAQDTLNARATSGHSLPSMTTCSTSV
jgi:site-specific DNA recombinase